MWKLAHLPVINTPVSEEEDSNSGGVDPIEYNFFLYNASIVRVVMSIECKVTSSVSCAQMKLSHSC